MEVRLCQHAQHHSTGSMRWSTTAVLQQQCPMLCELDCCGASMVGWRSYKQTWHGLQLQFSCKAHAVCAQLDRGRAEQQGLHDSRVHMACNVYAHTAYVRVCVPPPIPTAFF
jgi:hypothetical protein